jgi:hypothetical protein
MSAKNSTQDRRSNPATTVRTVHVDEVNQWGIRVDGEWINYSSIIEARQSLVSPVAGAAREC